MEESNKPGIRFSRRDFIKLAGRLAALPLAGALYSSVLEPLWFDLEELTLRLRRLPKSFDGFRLLQLSDLHLGGWMNRERLARVVEFVKTQQFDLIVMTGDYVFGHSWSPVLDQAADDMIAEISKLTAEYRVLSILGNHDHWTDAQRVKQMLSRCGVVQLNNDVYSIERGTDQLHIAGVDDIWEQQDRLDNVLAKLPETGAAILLAHEPDFADTSAKTGRFDLQLSGHSHGGQVVVPLYGAPILPYLGEKYYSGLYRVVGMWQYTNRGVGMIYPFVRFNCRPEITIITLQSA